MQCIKADDKVKLKITENDNTIPRVIYPSPIPAKISECSFDVEVCKVRTN